MINKSFHYLLIFLLAISIVGCASIRQPSHQFTPPEVRIASVELPEPIVELPTPILEVVELPVPILELHQRARIVMSEAEIQCLAQNIYFEARGEGEIGMRAAGYVVLNRIADGRFANTVCGVVHSRKGGCQFSWSCGGRVPRIHSQESYRVARQVAIDVMQRLVPNPIDDSIFFRHRSLPHQKGARYRVRVGAHNFYAAI